MKDGVYRALIECPSFLFCPANLIDKKSRKLDSLSVPFSLDRVAVPILAFFLKAVSAKPNPKCFSAVSFWSLFGEVTLSRSSFTCSSRSESERYSVIASACDPGPGQSKRGRALFV